jgi:cell division protein FtsB
LNPKSRKRWRKYSNWNYNFGENKMSIASFFLMLKQEKLKKVEEENEKLKAKIEELKVEIQRLKVEIQKQRK